MIQKIISFNDLKLGQGQTRPRHRKRELFYWGERGLWDSESTVRKVLEVLSELIYIHSFINSC